MVVSEVRKKHATLEGFPFVRVMKRQYAWRDRAGTVYGSGTLTQIAICENGAVAFYTDSRVDEFTFLFSISAAGWMEEECGGIRLIPHDPSVGTYTFYAPDTAS